ARQHVKAVLSGDGGDEVFGGYFQHLYGYRQQFVQSMIPPPFRRSAAWAARFVPACLKLKPYLATAALSAAHWVEPTTFFSLQQRHALYTGNRPVVGTHESLRTDIFRHNAAFDGLSQLQLYDLIRYLPGDILVKV